MSKACPILLIQIGRAEKLMRAENRGGGGGEKQVIDLEWPYSTWSVCLLLNTSLFTCLFVPQTIHCRRRIKVGNFKRFSLKMVRCEARAFPVCTAYGDTISQPFFYSAENAHAYKSGPRG